jgi:hypothetical protein
MEAVEFRDIDVLDEAAEGLLCQILARRVTVPSLLLQPGTAVQRTGDRGTLVIPRWLGIGLGLVWPFPTSAGGGRQRVPLEDERACGDAPNLPGKPRHRPPRRATRPHLRPAGHGA